MPLSLFGCVLLPHAGAHVMDASVCLYLPLLISALIQAFLQKTSTLSTLQRHHRQETRRFYHLLISQGIWKMAKQNAVLVCVSQVFDSYKPLYN